MEGNGKINLEEKNDCCSDREDNGWRQSQIQSERKVERSEEKQNMMRNENNILHKVKSYTDNT